MGIWDTISGTLKRSAPALTPLKSWGLKRNAPDLTALKRWFPSTDSLKHNAPDLTALKSWFPSTDSLKRNAPDGTAVKNACSAVRDNVIPYFRSEEARSKIAQVGTIVAKNATYEGLKFVPGGNALYNFAASCVHDYNNSNKQEVDVKELQAKVLRLEKELGELGERNKESPSMTNKAWEQAINSEDVIDQCLYDDEGVLEQAMPDPVAPGQEEGRSDKYESK
ncbi:hypothetical protein RchiOBHm_Chr5g0035271 [Rosa chinensis]|uniref:Uncharacterized protein n=1 Tax=Rosa chinensis TaxID=74649 RepID=A0A2P6QB60_ROSCH|nr:uncharacterized protein LOC112166453 [Rosa chinensis]PRQ31418.1 hypothetical protein RchiOBHm_Chr5g0035271 [Rosa chinensis]